LKIIKICGGYSILKNNNPSRKKWLLIILIIIAIILAIGGWSFVDYTCKDDVNYSEQ
jgi:flagellar basal body-associated protein FliL